MTSDARGLGLASATALVISHTVAVGIFLAPGEIIGALGSPALTFALWIVSSAMILAGAVTFGALASRYPETGGLYVYLRESWGPRIAFLYGWQSLLIMDPGITAALASGVGQYAVVLWPAAAGFERFIAVAAIWTIALLNMSGLAISARVFGWMTAIKLGTLAGVIVLAFAIGEGRWQHFTTIAAPPGDSPIAAGIAMALVGIFFSFGGFWETGRIAGEVRDARRSLPRALVFGVLSISALYVLTTAAFVYLVPPAEASSAAEFARRAGTALLGSTGPAILASVVLVSVIASMMAMVMVVPRLYEAMSRDGLFPAVIAARHSATGAPVRATLVLATFASMLAVLGTFEQIAAFFMCTTLGFVALAAAGVFARHRADPSELAVVGYPFTPMLFIGFVVTVVLLVAVNRPVQAAAGAALLIVGLAVSRLFVTASATAQGAMS
jgi:APA family basic amino acid/polyamine antiporter